MLDRQVSESERLLQLEQARADKGEIAKMQAARTEAEHMRLVAERDGARSDLEEARAACAELVAEPCAPFGSEDAARAFLVAGAGTPLPTAWSEEIESRRPDLAALAAAERAAERARRAGQAPGDPRRHRPPRLHLRHLRRLR